MAWRNAAAILWVGLACGAEPDVKPETVLLGRICVTMAENLARQPNYTCAQTIERSQRRAPARRFQLVDTVRLEVALVGGKELFAWPGAGKFEETELIDMVGGGAIGNGSFALHARSVFLSHAATFRYMGEEVTNGRSAVRYAYRVPQFRSGYRIRIAPNEAIVGYHGSFWVDRETLDLSRLEVHAEDIPPQLPLAESSDVMEYGRVRIGDGEFLLPVSSELTMTDLYGNQSRNRTRFSDCRQYTGESTLSFGEPPESAAAPETPAISEVRLPPGLSFELELATELDERSAVGDAVTATLVRAVRKHGKLLAPKGATLAGRVVRLEKRPRPFEHFVVGLQFSSLHFENHRADFLAALDDLAPVPGLIGPRTASPFSQVRQLEAPPEAGRSGVGVFLVKGTRLRVPHGLRMHWVTEPNPQENP